MASDDAAEALRALRPMLPIAARDYILSWTDLSGSKRRLAARRALRRRHPRSHRYGETYDYTNVIANSVQKMSASRMAAADRQDVIWNNAGRWASISSHRVFKTAPTKAIGPTARRPAETDIAHRRPLHGAERQDRRRMARPRRICGCCSRSGSIPIRRVRLPCCRR